VNLATTTPHDVLIHAALRHPRHAEAWLRARLGPEIAAICDWPTLRLVGARIHGPGLRTSLADFVYVVRVLGTDLWLAFTIEHRSYPHPGLHDTLVRYSSWLAHGARRRRRDAPVAVIATVLYHGPGALDLRPSVAIECPPALAAMLGPLQPQLRVLADNLTAQSEVQILAQPLTAFLRLAMLGVRFLPHLDPAGTIAALDRWGALLREVDRDDGPPPGEDAIETFGWYLLHVNETPVEDVRMALERNLQRAQEKFMSTAEKLKAEGRLDGLAKGRVATLLRLLARRFGVLPAEVEARLREASSDELDRWTDRVLDAPTLEAVFAGG